MKDCSISTFETAWCPGCGDHAILEALKETLISLGKKPHEVLIVGGIGQAAKTPGFVARAFSGDTEHLKQIMEAAINHKGYALVDILQPCVSFNKVTTFQWYKKECIN